MSAVMILRKRKGANIMRRMLMLKTALMAVMIAGITMPGWAKSPKMKMTTSVPPGITIPGKGWNTLLRLYGPLQPWFDRTWRLGEIELVK
jgi:hypothetical protein